MRTYTEKDFVEVVDESNPEVEHPPVPKSWLGTDKLAPGIKRKGKESKEAKSASNTPPAREPGQEPAGNATRDEWAAFAVEKGAKPEDLVVDGKDLTRDELKAKYATPKD